MKNKSTKHALLASVLSIVMCFAMLIGSTFAWFTDEVKSGMNKIVAGNLDVELEYSLDGTTWTTVDENTNMFKEDALWEPGYTEVVYLRVSNVGTLALKYQFGINVADKVIGKTADDRDIDLSNFIEFGVVEAEAVFADRAAARAAVNGNTALISAGYSSAEGHLIAGDKSNMLALVVYMPETVDNAANYAGDNQPSINLGIKLVATQDAVENDSFGNDYDVNVPIDFVPVQNEDELLDAVANGKNIVLNNDVEITKILDFSKSVTISGNGNTILRENGNCIISAQNITDDITITLQNVDLDAGNIERCVSIYNNANINLVLDNCSASANYYALNIAGNNSNVNLTIKNSQVTGWCAFQTWSAGTKATFENCTLIGINDFGYNADGWNDFANIVINTDAPNTELTFTNCRFEANQTTGNKQYLLSVRAPGAKVTLTDCSFFADGAEIPENKLGKYISVHSAAADLQLTIDGTLIPIA